MKRKLAVAAVMATLALLIPVPETAQHRTYFPLIGQPKQHKAGICYPKEDLQDRGQALSDIGAVATMDWGFGYGARHDIIAREHGIEFLPMQYGCGVDVAKVSAYAEENPGSRWLAFNEPDGMGNCAPEAAAVAYHTLREAVKAADPTAKLYCCGTAFWPAHIEYHEDWADAYRAMYGDWPQVDGMHIHSYASVYTDRFNWQARQQELTQFREWQQQQPWARRKRVIISEWAVLSASWMTDDKQRIAQEFIPAMLPWLDAQRWIELHLWFSTWAYEDLYEPSHIFERDTDTLTIVGEAWKGAK